MLKSPKAYAEMLRDAFDTLDKESLKEMAVSAWREGRFPGVGPKYLLEVLKEIDQ